MADTPDTVTVTVDADTLRLAVLTERLRLLREQRDYHAEETGRHDRAMRSLTRLVIEAEDEICRIGATDA